MKTLIYLAIVILSVLTIIKTTNGLATPAVCLQNNCGASIGLAAPPCRAFCLVAGFNDGQCTSSGNNEIGCKCLGSGNSALLGVELSTACNVCSTICTSCSYSTSSCDPVKDDGNLSGVNCVCSN